MVIQDSKSGTVVAIQGGNLS